MRTLCCLILLASFTTVYADEPPLEDLLAIATDSTNAFETRRDAVRKASSIDQTGRSDAHHARLLMDFPNPSRMVAAEKAIKRAIRKDGRNPNYLGLISEYYWRIGRRSGSLDYAEKAIDRFPSHPVGYYWSGRYQFWQTMKYLWMSRVETNQDSRGRERSHRIELGQWGEEARVRSQSHLQRALELEPTHDAARRYLGLIYYQTRQSSELRNLYLPVVEQHPEMPVGYFTVGMSYQLEEKTDLAFEAYQRGLQVMSEDEQRFMLAVFTDTRTDTTVTPPSLEDLRRFWTGRDPLYLSAVNERMLEQCRRVAYANLRYGEPEKGIAGWTTDRGQAYIRYGEPLVLEARPPEIDTGIDDPIVAQRYQYYDSALFGSSSDQYQFGKEIWQYENFVLVFDNTDTRDAWTFRIANLDGAIIGLEDLVERVPTRFEDPFQNRRFPVEYQIGQFRAPGGKSRVEIYYSVPVSRVTAETKRGLGIVDLEKGYFLFDTAWDTVDVRRSNVDRLAWIKDGKVKGGYLLSSEVANLVPGSYHLAAEVVDRKRETVGGFRTPLSVRSFSNERLEISSILVARRVIEKPDRPFGRSRYVVLPNPIKSTPRNRKAFFYFEVYNLQRDAFGRTRYEVTYQTKPVPTGEWDQPPDWTTAVKQEVTGDQPWEPLYLELDVADAQPGLRDFRVIIEDLQSSQSAEQATQYRIRW